MESCSPDAGIEPSAANNGEDNSGAPFEVTVIDKSEVKKVLDENKYVKELADGCFLSLLQETKTKKAFKENKEKGLFHLFLSTSMFDAILTWTNKNLSEKGKQKVSKEKFLAYVGLEIAMSLISLNQIRQYWETKMFSGHQDFKDVMSRNDFEEIRGATKFHPPEGSQMHICLIRDNLRCESI